MISFSHSSPGIKPRGKSLKGKVSNSPFSLEHTPIHGTLPMPNKWTNKQTWRDFCRLSLRHTLHLSHGLWFLWVENSWVPTNYVLPSLQPMNLKILIFLSRKNHLFQEMTCDISYLTSLVRWWPHNSECVNKVVVTLVFKSKSQ